MTHTGSDGFPIIEVNEPIEWDLREVGPNPARVRVSLGLTKQPAPYESIRCDVSLEIPTYPTQRHATEAVDQAASFVEQKVLQLMSSSK